MTTSYRNFSTKSVGSKEWLQHVYKNVYLEARKKKVKLYSFCNKIYSVSRNTVIFLMQWEKGVILEMPQT